LGDTVVDLALPQVIELLVRVTETNGSPVRDAWVTLGSDSVARFANFPGAGTGHCQWPAIPTDTLGVAHAVAFPEAKILGAYAEETQPPPLSTQRTASIGNFTALGDTTVTIVLPPGATTSVDQGRRALLSLFFTNPVHTGVLLTFEVPANSSVKLRVFDLQGRMVARIVEGTLRPGLHVTTWDLMGLSGELPSGVYLVSIEQGSSRVTKRLHLLR
jgi:hypothetical protein